MSTKAARWNAKMWPSVAWHGTIPETVLVVYTGLDIDPSRADADAWLSFADATKRYQRDHEMKGVDGMLGSKTLKHMSGYAPAPERYIIHDGVRRACATNVPHLSRRHPFDSPEGLNGYDRGAGYSKKRKGKPTLIVLHWSVTWTARSLWKMLDGNMSTHFCIEKEDVWQFLDTQHVAWHGRGANFQSVGVDLAQMPQAKHVDENRDKYGYDTQVVPNHTGRGHAEICSLDPRSAEALRSLLEDLCLLLDIPRDVPRNADGSYYHGADVDTKTFRGIIGHHHFNPGKWDCACWFPAIFDGWL